MSKGMFETVDEKLNRRVNRILGIGYMVDVKENLCSVDVEGGAGMIYTTYFANLRNLPSYIVPISIAAKAPSWYHGKQYKKIAPNYETLNRYKHDHDEARYVEEYMGTVINTLDPQEVEDDLWELAGLNMSGMNPFPRWSSSAGDIALVCYEKPDTFCHRHIVSNWLSTNGVHTEEF